MAVSMDLTTLPGYVTLREGKPIKYLARQWKLDLKIPICLEL